MRMLVSEGKGKNESCSRKKQEVDGTLTPLSAQVMPETPCSEGASSHEIARDSLHPAPPISGFSFLGGQR